MPEKLERKLRKEAKKHYPSDKEAQDHYVYGTMNNLGYMHGNKTTTKRKKAK